MKEYEIKEGMKEHEVTTAITQSLIDIVQGKESCLEVKGEKVSPIEVLLEMLK